MKETTEPGSAGDLLFEDTANPATEIREDSPRRLFALTVASVFLAEVLVMAILARIPSLPQQAMWIIDGVLVAALLIPVLYLFLVRPLRDRIREHSRLRKALGRSREAYRSLIDSTEDSIYLIDARGRYLFVNRHHAAWFGRAFGARLCAGAKSGADGRGSGG